MFRFPKTLDIVTLFHKPSSPASIRVATLLKQASAHASQTATEDQASDTAPQTNAPIAGRETFELEITEELPTTDQLRTILEYVGTPAIPTVVKGASTTVEALKKFKESTDSFQRPVVVDWNNGKAIAGSNDSEILKLLKETKS